MGEAATSFPLKGKEEIQEGLGAQVQPQSINTLSWKFDKKELCHHHWMVEEGGAYMIDQSIKNIFEKTKLSRTKLLVLPS